ncbi:sugar nucleotide-binding protein [Candidatus Peregrinibacteria bacterium]|nr:sugar nucleotide-binding protein [Candidatus Peregrinibacteria bacterium]
MKTLIFGSKGYLGQQFLGVYPDAATPSGNIADRAFVSRVLDEVRPDVVINAAGKTGRPNIDWCEDHKHETIEANITGPLVLLEECANRGIYWVHLGSGCIYQGDGSASLPSRLGRAETGTTGNGGRGFSEEDPPNYAGSFYSRTKAWIDQILKDFPVLNLRLRMPFDGSKNERNLITKLIKYPTVLDVQNSITYLPDFLKVAKKLIADRATGTYNVVNPGSISPYEIMEKYTEMVDPAHTFKRLRLEDLSSVAKAGRSNCILSTKKIESLPVKMKPVKEAVEEALATINNYEKK